MKYTSFVAVLCFLWSLVQAALAFTVGPSTGLRRCSSLHMTVLTYGTKKKDFKEGSPMSDAVKQLGVPVKYSCKKGDCATCQITLAGRYVRPCVAKVPPAPKLKSLQEKGLEIRA